VRVVGIAALIFCCVVARVEGQADSGARAALRDTNSNLQNEHAVRGEFGVMVVGVGTRASPAVFGRTLTEGYLTQPNVMGDVRYRSLRLLTTVNFEGYTLRRGQLNAGMYGEGYVDRRHPHTLVHEAMLTAKAPIARGVQFSLAAGKGFTSYGTDDPMMRPFVLYPVNHHHAQIIERVQTIGAVQIGGLRRSVALEHTVFNGDEPYAPFAGPRWSRFGDSRATRVTVRPANGVEVQASRAFVKSPGIVQGGALDHAQRSVSLRMQRDDARGLSRYLLAEVARTDETVDGARAFRFESMLAEGAVEFHGWRVAARAEQTERPENERLLDPFRIASGHIDFQIIGVTRWRVATVHLSAPAASWRGVGTLRLAPFVEVARAHATARRLPTVFEPAQFYGNAAQLSVNVGARLHVGTMRHRMGRYGALELPAASSPHHHRLH